MKRFALLIIPLVVAAGCKPAAPVRPLSLDAGRAEIVRLRKLCHDGIITPGDAAYKAEIISDRMDVYCERVAR